MPTHIVTISATKTNPNPLTIVDDEGHEAHTTKGDEELKTLVQPGDVVKFQIAKDCDIQSIDNITRNAGSATSVFEHDPFKNPDGSWEVHIKAANVKEDAPHEGDTAAYTFAYTVDGKAYIEDPKIAIHV